ncbi:caprin-2 isoform X1 [Entelurus aequoreus]|uniref:caprin-2 isoform X1 n=1 Tax=Entelurus aequoreus TaxID=161455 RepID=UPI002B1E504F|nr:caprin-2 isoform X1 [Entelurus aequoreus]
MVQLPTSPKMGVPHLAEQSEERKEKLEDTVIVGSTKGDISATLCALESIEFSKAYHGYENYIEDGLICLKHKVRNLEKKKLKLEDYKKRLDCGETLNQDQMAAADTYEQVVHNLKFVQELHKTLDSLTQNLLSSQKRAVKRQQVVRIEAERKQLNMVLQIQHLLTSLEQEHVKKDLLNGHNQAPYLPVQKLHSLGQLANLLGVRQDNRLSLEQRMAQATVVYMDLLEGKDKPVAGSTFKLLKEELTRLLNSKYFTCLPFKKTPDISKMTPTEVPKETIAAQNRIGEFRVMKVEEPPDCWDLDGVTSPQVTVHKPWKGAATLIPKVPITDKSKSTESRKERKAKRSQNAKTDVLMDLPGLKFDSLSTLSKDPILRKKDLEDLMTNICGSFSFIQNSLLDCGSFPDNGHSKLKREPPEQSSPLAQADLISSSESLSKEMHSTPNPNRLLDRKTSLTNGDQCLKSYGLELSSDENLQLPDRGKLSLPLFGNTELTITTLVTESPKHSSCTRTTQSNSIPVPKHTFSTPPTRQTVTSAHFQNIESVFNERVEVQPRYTTSSTQTLPEFAPSEQSQPLGGSYIFQAHSKNSGPLFCSSRDSGSHHAYGCGGRHNSSAAWSESSKVSSPEREGEFTMVDSGHGDSLHVSHIEFPHSPRGHHHTTLLPMQLYPVSQPLRVAFTASRTANYAPGNLDQPIIFDQLHTNLGEMYDSRIGRFTCPVNGTYVFIFHILKLAINVPLYINLMCNEEVMVSAYANDGAPDHETASNHAILPLFQGDQVWLRLHRGAIYGSTWKYSTFSGFLLYHD